MEVRRQEALDWYERLKEDSSPATRAAFEAWLENPPNAAEFEQQARLDALMQSAGLRGSVPDQIRPSKRIGWHPVALCAGALGAAIAVLFVWSINGKADHAPTPSLAVQSPDLSRVRRLADGSIAILSADADLRAAADSRGSVLMHGSARFLVVHDPSRPFTVLADGVTVVARGTVFDVDREGKGARVTLIEGQVEVWHEKRAREKAAMITLAPGQTLGASTEKPKAAPGTTAERVTVIEADELPLVDLVRIINSRGGTRLLLGDPAFAARKITGRFDVSDPYAASIRIAAALNLHLAVRDDGMIVSLVGPST